MKAILIKTLGSTQKLPQRFKVSIHGQKDCTISAESEGFDHSSSTNQCVHLQAAIIALKYWKMDRILSELELIIGQVPNGDHVVTFKR